MASAQFRGLRRGTERRWQCGQAPQSRFRSCARRHASGPAAATFQPVWTSVALGHWSGCGPATPDLACTSCRGSLRFQRRMFHARVMLMVAPSGWPRPRDGKSPQGSPPCLADLSRHGGGCTSGDLGAPDLGIDHGHSQFRLKGDQPAVNSFHDRRTSFVRPRPQHRQGSVGRYEEILGGTVTDSICRAKSPQIDGLQSGMSVLIRGRRPSEDPGERRIVRHFEDYSSQGGWRGRRRSTAGGRQRGPS